MQWAPKGIRLAQVSARSASSQCLTTVAGEIPQRNKILLSYSLLWPWRTDAGLPTPENLASILRASSDSSFCYEHTRQLQSLSIKIGCTSNVLVANSLIAMYAKFGHVEAAENIFFNMENRDHVTLNSMVSSYERNGEHDQAIEFFRHMHFSGAELDEFCLSTVLRACTSRGELGLGRSIHAYSMKLGRLPNLYIQSAMLKLYCDCENVQDASLVFDEMRQRDIVCWNSIISGLVKNNRDLEAIGLFKEMAYTGQGSDSYTLASLVSSSYCVENMNVGQQFHAYAVNTGTISSLSVGNALITMYCRCRGLSEAMVVFQTMNGKNIISWTAMICGYAQQSREEEAMQLFYEMMKEGSEVVPNYVTFTSVFSCCRNLAAELQGKVLLPTVLKLGFMSKIHVQNSILSFFAECGCMEDAEAMFATILEPDIVSWNSLLTGYSKQGRGNEALLIFEKMQKSGMIPDSITFLSLLSACRHAALLSEGIKLFEIMRFQYQIEPHAEHFTCLIDLFGRAGQFCRAAKSIDQVDWKHQEASVWRTLLGACKTHDNTKLAATAAERVLQLDPYNSEAYIVLSNIYASSGMWDRVAEYRSLMKNKKVIKEPGFSWIESGSKVHCFVGAMPSHTQIREIRLVLVDLNNNMKFTKNDVQEFLSLESK